MKLRPSRVCSPEEAAEWAERLRRKGQRTVFTNGIFDLVHPGHIRYLREARALGDALIVAMNSDRSARTNKGAARPITPEYERAEILLALASVDAVVIFDEETPHEIIGRIQPDVLVKGADWGPTEIVGRDIVEARGGRVVRIDLTPGFSTTAIIERVRAALGRRDCS